VQPPTYLQDYHCASLTDIIHSSLHVDPLSSSSSSKYPLSNQLPYNNLSSTHKHYILNLPTIPEPSSYEEAMGDENWRLAIQAELTALVKNNTTSLAKLHAQDKAIGCK
jgi:hypothetical protein